MFIMCNKKGERYVMENKKRMTSNRELEYQLMINYSDKDVEIIMKFINLLTTGIVKKDSRT